VINAGGPPEGRRPRQTRDACPLSPKSHAACSRRRHRPRSCTRWTDEAQVGTPLPPPSALISEWGPVRGHSFFLASSETAWSTRGQPRRWRGMSPTAARRPFRAMSDADRRVLAASASMVSRGSQRVWVTLLDESVIGTRCRPSCIEPSLGSASRDVPRSPQVERCASCARDAAAIEWG
jgi:hypothetical protein